MKVKLIVYSFFSFFSEKNVTKEEIEITHCMQLYVLFSNSIRQDVLNTQ